MARALLSCPPSFTTAGAEMPVPTGSDVTISAAHSTLLASLSPETVMKYSPKPSDSAAIVKFPEQKLLVKWGPQVTVGECQCQWFVRQKLGGKVPVPHVYAWRTHDDMVFKYEEFVPGDCLNNAWKGMDKKDRATICKELVEMIECWRSRIETENGQRDGFYNRVYPFKNEDAFFFEMYANAISASARAGHMDDKPPLHFSHGDLNKGNVMVRKRSNGKWTVTAIIDWNVGGWYPKAWEEETLKHLRNGQFP